MNKIKLCRMAKPIARYLNHTAIGKQCPGDKVVFAEIQGTFWGAFCCNMI